ncbi:MAG: CrcB family protein [Anaerolineae bacterium]|nr:CrcB family protein [Anaerolineae bacterium]
MQLMVSLALAGALGTVSRYMLSSVVQRLSGDGILSTWAVNIVGCFLFGLIEALAEQRLSLSNETRLVLLTGFMGAFTTFSTFIFDTSGLLNDLQWLPALLNIAGQVLTGIVFLLLGLAVGQSL